jgi:hypothetical protein
LQKLLQINTENKNFHFPKNSSGLYQKFLKEYILNQITTMMKIPKIAIYVSGGIVQGVRSNIGQNLEVEIVDADSMYNQESNKADEYWEELQTELEFGNY